MLQRLQANKAAWLDLNFNITATTIIVLQLNGYFLSENRVPGFGFRV